MNSPQNATAYPYISASGALSSKTVSPRRRNTITAAPAAHTSAPMIVV